MDNIMKTDLKPAHLSAVSGLGEHDLIFGNVPSEKSKYFSKSSRIFRPSMSTSSRRQMDALPSSVMVTELTVDVSRRYAGYSLV